MHFGNNKDNGKNKNHVKVTIGMCVWLYCIHSLRTFLVRRCQRKFTSVSYNSLFHIQLYHIGCMLFSHINCCNINTTPKVFSIIFAFRFNIIMWKYNCSSRDIFSLHSNNIMMQDGGRWFCNVRRSYVSFYCHDDRNVEIELQ